MKRGGFLVAALVVAAPAKLTVGFVKNALWFFRLGLLVLGAFCVSALLLGCAASSTHTQAWAQATPSGKSLFRICRRHPHVDPNARHWYDRGDGTPRTTSLPLDELLKGREAKAVYIHDPYAPPESRKLLGLAFQDLPCDKPPPPPPPPKDLAAKEKEGEKKKDEAQKAEQPKPLPKPISREASAVERRVEAHGCTAYEEPDQRRRRSRTGARTCTRVLVHRTHTEQAVEVKPPEPARLSEEAAREYEDWGLTPADVSTLAEERGRECLEKICHARHQNFLPKRKKKPAETHNGQSLSTGSGGGGGAKTTVKTRQRIFGKPKDTKPNGAAAGQGSPANAGTAANERKVPNPNGKKGGPEHQAKVAEIEADIKERGLKPTTEYRVDTPGGEKKRRYVDVAGVDANDNPVEFHQVGKQTKDGRPVARERKPLDEVEHAKGLRPNYHPYNKQK